MFVLSSFLDNIAAALIGGAMAHTVFRAKVHIGYLAAIVAASNARRGQRDRRHDHHDDVDRRYFAVGGCGSIYRRHRCARDLRYSGFASATALCADPAAFGSSVAIDWLRVGVVAFILIAAVVVNITINTRYNEISDLFPFLGAAVWVALLITALWRRLTGRCCRVR